MSTVTPAAPLLRQAPATGAEPGTAARGPVPRIALLIHPGGWGGMELHTLELARTLATRGHETSIVVLGGAEYLERFYEAPDRNFRILPVDLGGRTVENVGFTTWRQMLRGVDADIAVLARGAILALPLSLDLAARTTFPRYLTIEHLLPPHRPRRASRRHLNGLLPGLGLWWYRTVPWQVARVHARSRLPARMFSVSRAVTDRFVRDYHVSPDAMVTVPNGIDPDRFRFDRVARRRLREDWGLPQSAVVVGSVGRIEHFQKGLDTLLDVVARLRREAPEFDLHCVLVGEGPDRERLETQASRLGIAEHVRFAGRSERPWEALSALDLFLLPSRFEGHPLSLMEAMACERAVVAFGAGGVPEVLVDPALGCLVPEGDLNAFFEACRASLALDQAERRALGRNAREHIVEHCSATARFAELADAILTEAPSRDGAAR